MSDFPPTTAGGAAADDARGPSPLGDTSSAEGGENKKRNSIADRFLNAKEEQRKREEERRSNFKSQRGSENLGSITGRFEAAKQEQIEKEESRRSSFKTQNTSCESTPILPSLHTAFLYLPVRLFTAHHSS